MTQSDVSDLSLSAQTSQRAVTGACAMAALKSSDHKSGAIFFHKRARIDTRLRDLGAAPRLRSPALLRCRPAWPGGARQVGRAADTRFRGGNR